MEATVFRRVTGDVLPGPETKAPAGLSTEAGMATALELLLKGLLLSGPAASAAKMLVIFLTRTPISSLANTVLRKEDIQPATNIRSQPSQKSVKAFIAECNLFAAGKFQIVSSR